MTEDRYNFYELAVYIPIVEEDYGKDMTDKELTDKLNEVLEGGFTEEDIKRYRTEFNEIMWEHEEEKKSKIIEYYGQINNRF